MSKPTLRAAAALLAALALTASCKNTTGGNEPSGEATTLDVTSVSTGVAEVSTVIPVCRKSSGQQAAALGAPSIGMDSWAERFLALATDQTVRASLSLEKLGSTKPSDQFGDCGGRITYPSYNHANGTTTGTYAFESYCSIDSDTGERTTSNGSITFKDTGTPTASGPVTTKVEASSQSGITTTTKSSSGATLESHKIAFENLIFTPGVPGGSPTSSKPDVVSIDEITNTNLVTNKSYRQTDLKSTSFETSGGGQQASVTGRGYRSNGEYFGISTTTPLTMNSSGSYTGGQFTFTGADNTQAVLTIVPGGTLQGTMTVNGQPLTSVPVCK